MSMITNSISNVNDPKLIEKAKESRESMGALLEKYTPLVYITTNKWQGYNNTRIPKEDLIQEGFIGLMKAANSFDYTRGTRFTTWAICCIQGAIRLAIQKEKRHEHVSLSGLVDDECELGGLVTQEERVINYDSNLNIISEEINLDEIVSKRELELIRIRYNLDV